MTRAAKGFFVYNLSKYCSIVPRISSKESAGSIATLLVLLINHLNTIKVKLPTRVVYCWSRLETTAVLILAALAVVMVLWIAFSKKAHEIAMILGAISIGLIVFGSVHMIGKTDSRIICTPGESYEYVAQGYQNFYDSGITVEIDGVKYSWDGESVKTVDRGPDPESAYVFSEAIGYDKVLYPKEFNLKPVGFIQEDRIVNNYHRDYGCIYRDVNTNENYVYVNMSNNSNLGCVLLKLTPADDGTQTVTPYLPVEDATIVVGDNN